MSKMFELKPYSTNYYDFTSDDAVAYVDMEGKVLAKPGDRIAMVKFGGRKKWHCPQGGVVLRPILQEDGSLLFD